MQPIDNHSSQFRRYVANDGKEFNYVGLTLTYLQSAANRKEGLRLMLNSNMSKIPCHPTEFSHRAAHGLQELMQGGISHVNQGQHQEIDSNCPSGQLAVRLSTPSNAARMLEWKDHTDSLNGDCGIPMPWMNEILTSHENYKGPEEQDQNQTLSLESHTFTSPHDVTNHQLQSHGWLINTFGDSIAKSTDQSDLSGLLQLTTPVSNALSPRLFGPHSTLSMSNCPNPHAFDPNICIPVVSTNHFEYKTPASHLIGGNLLRSNSAPAPAPAPERMIPHENLLTRQPSTSLQLNFGDQNTKATTSARQLCFDLPEDIKHQANRSTFSVPMELVKVRMNSEDGYVDMARGCGSRNLSVYSLPAVEPTVKLPPLDLQSVLGADALNLHMSNVDSHERNSRKYTTSEYPAATPFLSDLPSLLRPSSVPARSVTVGPTLAELPLAGSFITPEKKRVAPRRSRFDPHDTPCTFVSERIRREKLTEKYNILKSLIPKSTKVDRASIVEETIAHVQSLKSQIKQLEKAKQEKLKAKAKRQKLQAGEGHSGQAFEQCEDVTCQWLTRTSSHGTEVDMRIVQDEILVSIVQKHLPRFLLRMVTALESKLKLEIINATGSVIDGRDVYNFKLKITGKSKVVANEIMTHMIDTLDSVF